MSQAAKFLLLGAFTTLVDYALYSLLILFGIDYVIAVVAGYSLGLFANYTLGRKYIFMAGTKLKSTHREFVAVVAIAVMGMLINIAIVKALSYSLWHIDPLFSRIVAIGVTFFWNYFMRKLFVYL